MSAGPTGSYGFSNQPDVQIENDGRVTLCLGAAASFEPTTSPHGMVAKTSTITIQAPGYGAAAGLGFSWLTWGTTHVLLRNRRYGLVDNYSSGAVGPYAFTASPDVEIRDNGETGEIVLSGGAAESFDVTGPTTITARLTPVVIDKRGYPGGVAVNWFDYGSSIQLLKNRRYNIIDNHSSRLDGAAYSFSNLDISVGAGPNPTISLLGDTIDKSFDLQGNALVAKLATITITPTTSYPGQICLQPFPVCGSAGEPVTATVLTNRGYPSSPDAGSLLGVRPDGSCTVTSFTSQGHTFHVSCALLRETGLSASGLVVDPAGFKGPICIGSAGCATAGNASAPLILPVGTHTIGTQNSAEAESPDRSLGTLAVSSNGTVLLSSSHFTALDAQNRLVAITAPVEVIHAGYELQLVFMHSPDYHSGPQWQERLITGRRYALAAGYSQDMDDGGGMFSYGPDPHDIKVTDVGISVDLLQTGKHFSAVTTAEGLRTLTAKTLPVTIIHNGYPSLLAVAGGAYGWSPSWTTGLIVGRRYFMGAGYTWDLTLDSWILGFEPPHGLEVDVDQVRVLGDLAQRFFPRKVGDQHRVEAIVGTMTLTSSSDFAGTFCVQGANFPCGTGGGTRIAVPVIPGRRYFVTPNGSEPVKVEMNGLCPDTPTIQVTGGSVQVQCSPSPTAVPVPVLSAQATSGSSVSLTWTASSGLETGFLLERARDGEAFSEVDSFGAEVRSHSDTGLQAGVYRYRILATGIGGDSGYTEPVVVGVGALAPPTALTASLADWLGTTGPIHLQWVDNAASESGYRVYRAVNGGSLALLDTVTVSGNGSYFDWVGPGRYSYLVRAFDALGESADSNMAAVIVEPPVTPTLAGTLLADGTIRLTWSALENVHTAVIHRSVDGQPAVLLGPVTPLTATAMVDTDVTSGHLYRYHMTVTNLLGTVSSAPVSVASSVLPVPPGAFTAVVGTPTRIDLSWTHPSTDLMHFIVERSTNNLDYTSIGQPGGALRQLSDPFAVALTPYWYRVRAVNIAGASDPSTTGPIQIQPPNRPTLLRATVASATQINLTWTNDASIRTGIRVLRSPHQANAFQEIAPNGGADATSYNNSGLPLTTSFDYKVVAYNNGGASPDSDVVSSRTGAALVPTNFTATVVSTAQINLAWTDVINETDYQVERRINNGSYLPIGPNPMDQNSTGQNVSGLNQNDTYAFRVRARNALSPTPAWVTLTGLRTNAPAAPNQLTATSLSGSRIRLNWRDNSTNETGFHVERSVTGDTQGAWTQFVVGANVITYEDTGLSADTRYWYRVRAFNGTNNISQFTLTAVAQTRGLCVSDPNGTLCAGDRCAGSVCQSGVCVAAPPPNCNDNNTCTADSCDPTLPHCAGTRLRLWGPVARTATPATVARCAGRGGLLAWHGAVLRRCERLHSRLLQPDDRLREHARRGRHVVQRR